MSTQTTTERPTNIPLLDDKPDLHQMNSELQRRIEELEFELGKEKEAAQTLRTQMRESEAEREELLDDTTEENHALLEEIGGLNEQVVEQKVMIQLLQTKVSELQDKLDKHTVIPLHHQLAKTTRETYNVSQRIQRFELELEQEAEKLQMSLSDHEETQRTLTKEQSQTETLSQQNQTLLDQMGDLKDQVCERDVHIKSLQRQLGDLQEKWDQHTVNPLHHELAKIQGETRDLAQRSQHVEWELEQEKENLHISRTQHADTLYKVKEEQSKVQQLTLENHSLLAQTLDLKDRVDQQDLLIQELQRELSDHQDQSEEPRVNPLLSDSDQTRRRSLFRRIRRFFSLSFKRKRQN